jgi:hypothetical protein
LLQGSLTSPDVRAVDNAFQGMGISEAVQKLHYRDNNSEMLQQREAERRNSDAEYLLALSKRERMLEYGQQIKERRRSSDGEFQCNLMEKI